MNCILTTEEIKEVLIKALREKVGDKLCEKSWGLKVSVCPLLYNAEAIDSVELEVWAAEV